MQEKTPPRGRLRTAPSLAAPFTLDMSSTTAALSAAACKVAGRKRFHE